MRDGITWDVTLVDRLLRGLSLSVLGQHPLPEPLSRLLVLGRSETGAAGHASLAAVLMPTTSGGTLALSPLGLGRHQGATRIPADLSERFSTRPARSGGLFVLDDAGSEQFLIAPGIVRQVTVTCGVWPVLRQLVGPRAPALPLAGSARLSQDLDRFCEIVEGLLQAMYQAEDVAVPRLELVLRPTSASVQSAIGGLRRFTQSTAGFISRLPTSRGPGTEYEPEVGAGPGGEPTSFADVGGQDAARAELETICLAVSQPDAFRAWGARPPRGVLLYGPPGTGKTLLARALAHEAGARFLQVRATDVVSKWYGEAERRVQQAFDQARSGGAAVLFFDEIDALARDRSVSHEATHRIVSAFLENMDGLRETEGVIVLAATNRPEAVDEALLRPGRFDRLVEVPLPDAAGRRAIFAVHMRLSERLAGRQLFTPLDEVGWDGLLEATERFSGADIAETVRRALEVKVRSGAMNGEIEASELREIAAGVSRPF